MPDVVANALQPRNIPKFDDDVRDAAQQPSPRSWRETWSRVRPICKVWLCVPPVATAGMLGGMGLGAAAGAALDVAGVGSGGCLTAAARHGGRLGALASTTVLGTVGFDGGRLAGRVARHITCSSLRGVTLVSCTAYGAILGGCVGAASLAPEAVFSGTFPESTWSIDALPKVIFLMAALGAAGAHAVRRTERRGIHHDAFEDVMMVGMVSTIALAFGLNAFGFASSGVFAATAFVYEVAAPVDAALLGAQIAHRLSVPAAMVAGGWLMLRHDAWWP